MVLAVSNLNLGQPAAALDATRKATGLNPGVHDAWCFRLLAALELDDLEEAGLCPDALRAFPEALYPHLKKLAEIILSRPTTRALLPHLLELTWKVPPFQLWMVLFVESLLDSEQGAERARAALDNLRSRAPLSADGERWLKALDSLLDAMVQEFQNTTDQDEDAPTTKEDPLELACQAIVELDNNAGSGAWNGLGLVFHQRGLMEDADFCWGRMLDLQPNEATPLLMLARSAARRGERSQEEALLRRLLDIHPTDVRERARLCAVLIAQGRADDAEKEARRCLELLPSSAVSHVLVAQSLWVQGRYAEAEQSLDKATSLEPEAPGPWIDRSQLYRTSPGHRAKCLTVLEEASKRFPEDFRVWYLLAQAHLERHTEERPHLVQAEEALRHALQLAPENREVRTAEAQVRIAQGRWREALGVLDDLIDPGLLEPGEEGSLLRLTLDIAARGKPNELVAVLDEHGLKESWAPLRLALTMLSSDAPDLVYQAPKEVADTARELAEQVRRLQKTSNS